jgi:hypothetical protein
MAILTVGQKLNRFTVVKLDHVDSRYRKFYKVRCVCGKLKVINGALLISGNTKSCGCLIKDAAEKRRLPDDRGVINQIILGYKRHARDRGLSWGLSFEEVKTLIGQPCYYCDTEKSNKKVTKNCKQGFMYNGIDRINSKLGYTLLNCEPCCRVCNRAKNNMTTVEFFTWVSRLSDKARRLGIV